MIILQNFQRLERLLGLYPLGQRETIFVRIVYLASFILFNSTELIYIVLNIPDGIDKAAPAIAPFCAVVPTMTCYGYLLIIRERYYALMSDLQDIVDGSTIHFHQSIG